MASPGSATPSAPSRDFLEVFTLHADNGNQMPFDRFSELALYHPQVGYYRAPRRRIGRGLGSDFYTATSSGLLFGNLVVAACIKLLYKRDLGNYSFIEIGAETAGGVLCDVSHPFRETRALKLGEPHVLRGDCIVFSNELFDAQPFRRLVGRDGVWRELGVQKRGSELAEIELGVITDAWLPKEAPDGYVFDAPRRTIDLLRHLVTQPWGGLFVTFDYGRTLQELLSASPNGTARAYWEHTQSNDLLARPGEQDLTCHVCWDWLSDELATAGFTRTNLESQESFFMRYADDFVQTVLAVEGGRFSARKQTLVHLLHPAHMGQKFQVLHALRE